MVKKLFFPLLAAALCLTGWIAGCRKADPVVPANAAVLNLVIPAKILKAITKAPPKKVAAQDAVPDSSEGALEYYLAADGEAPVTGVILFDSGSNVGNFFINLPKAGNWLVSGEWFSLSVPEEGVKKVKSQLVVPGLNASPEFVGADMVNVQGTTSFTLNMEDIASTESNCYNGNITDPLSCDFGTNWLDLYSFNSGTASDSQEDGTGDIQALFDPVTTNTTYLGSDTGATYDYLGNGDLVNFPVVPSNAVFYPDTVAAKTAVVGSAAASITTNDIFAVKVPSTNALVWLQIWIDNVCGSETELNSSLIQFWFVYNNEGSNYMKFDQTANGAANCNQNTPPTPTPTLAP
ncbi:MAG TPA: hypothetical protein VK859_06745 [bacterium]|jgi:hypothetical protein|nr:hypothetical protein [bacterium]